MNEEKLVLPSPNILSQPFAAACRLKLSWIFKRKGCYVTESLRVDRVSFVIQ
jgi:hypothetical protein